jgi:hypothetical protein
VQTWACWVRLPWRSSLGTRDVFASSDRWEKERAFTFSAVCGLPGMDTGANIDSRCIYLGSFPISDITCAFNFRAALSSAVAIPYEDTRPRLY